MRTHIHLHKFTQLSCMNQDKLSMFFEFIHEILESTPSGNSQYEPTDLSLLMKQIQGRMPNFYRSCSNAGNADIYSQTNKKTINNHISKMENSINNTKDLEELRKVKQSGTY